MTALMWTCWNGDFPSTLALLDAEMSKSTKKQINLMSECGRTALVWAIEKNRQDIVELLLSRGADPNIALPSTGSAPLLIATRLNLQNFIECLITSGARINDRNADGISPLMWAAWNQKDEMVESLLALGASPLIKDRMGRCALEYSTSDSIQKRLTEEMSKISVEKRIPG